MLRFITVLVSALLFMQSAFADTARPEIGKYVFGYRGQEGAVVWMMRIGPQASNEALVQVSHVDNDIDGQIFRCKVKVLQEGEKSYTAVIKGESFELLRLKEGNGSLHIPEESATWSVAYSNELSDSDVANPEHFLTAYQNQQAPQ
ncbi:hypothetical protein [Escherichia sp. E4742]|uniref:hypothetical protein n=1 Tax=Escherichia sp. E4742 TaxID=2044467 RepID=UPI0010816EE5|nr:hypothetical protein [Escherichia sp. E4742]QLN18509.1 hypothetical protein HVZ29_06575 [Escherichia coli]QCT88898.1 hypothetical protein FEM44_17765 [Escherichia sp. E4742]QML55653.1 hypothetical protein HVX32_06265 [Escherichia coli]TGB57467.1 hypothetical protein CRI69_14620 [Escherichia sp. E4742]TLJ08129.1 hypothetical protein FEK62_17765 [Escherichia sp. E4742]